MLIGGGGGGGGTSVSSLLGCLRFVVFTVLVFYLFPSRGVLETVAIVKNNI